MQLERGRAKLISTSLRISGGHNSQVRTSHVSVLLLNGRTAQYSGQPLPLGQDEEIEMIAAGSMNRDGAFDIRAAYFPTLDLIRHNASIIQPVVAVIFIGIAMAMATPFLLSSGDRIFFRLIPGVVLTGFVAIGIYMIYSYVKNRRALSMVRAERHKIRPF